MRTESVNAACIEMINKAGSIKRDPFGRAGVFCSRERAVRRRGVVGQQ